HATASGRVLGRAGGSRPLDEDVERASGDGAGDRAFHTGVLVVWHGSSCLTVDVNRLPVDPDGAVARDLNTVGHQRDATAAAVHRDQVRGGQGDILGVNRVNVLDLDRVTPIDPDLQVAAHGELVIRPDRRVAFPRLVAFVVLDLGRHVVLGMDRDCLVAVAVVDRDLVEAARRLGAG